MCGGLDEEYKGEGGVPASVPQSGQGGSLPVSDAPVDTNAKHGSSTSSYAPVDLNADSDKPKEKDPQVVEGGKPKGKPEDDPKPEPEPEPKPEPEPESDDESDDEDDDEDSDEDSDDDAHDDADDDADEDADDDAHDDEDERPLSAQKRLELLKLKLVTQYKQNKKNEASDDSSDEARIVEGEKESSTAKIADSVGDFLGWGSLLGSGVASASTYFGDSGKEIGGIAGLTANSIGFLTSGIKAGTGMYRANRTKSRYASKIANTKVASGALGLIGSAAGAAGNLIGSYNDYPLGTPAQKDGSIAQGAFNMLKGTMDAIGGGLDYKASKDEKNAHGEIAGKADRISQGGVSGPLSPDRDLDSELDAARREIAEQKGKRDEHSPDFNSAALKDARQRRRNAKARKYAMQQAAAMHAVRANKPTKNVGSMVGGVFGGLGSILSGLGSILDPLGGTTSTVLKFIGAGSSLIGALSKGIGKVVDKKRTSDEKETLKNNKHDVVEDYLREKAGRIITEAQNIRLDDREVRNYGVHRLPIPTQDEARKIAVLRLFGKSDDQNAAAYNIDDDDRLGALNSEDYEKAFEILTEKRAKNILKSSPNDRNDMLNALGLSHDATLEDVKNALSGDIS